MSVEDLKRLCQPLYGFVYKYFDKPDFAAIEKEVLTFTLTVPEIFQLVQQGDQLIQTLEPRLYQENDIMDLWAHKELLLKTIIVLTHLPFLATELETANLVATAVEIRDRLIDVFSNKVVEDPNVVKAIQNGTLEQEIEKHKTQLFNFQPLFEKNRSYVVAPEGVDFQEIPEKF